VFWIALTFIGVLTLVITQLYRLPTSMRPRQDTHARGSSTAARDPTPVDPNSAS